MTVVPLFVCTGFLDSGKTTLVKETLMEQEWIQPGRTLLICCEEGEVEYPEEYLKSKNMVLHQLGKRNCSSVHRRRTGTDPESTVRR